MTELKQQDGAWLVLSEGTPFAKILPAEGATDTFEPLEDGAWKWHRHTETPVDRMRMEVLFFGKPDFTMIPAISYNGNGWGTFPEYVGDRDEDGTPWSFASHRATIPACTYSENGTASLALMSEANDNTACSLYAVDGGELHVVIFPEEEKPRTLQRHFWKGPFQGTMEPKQDFTAILQAKTSEGGKFRYKSLLDFAWRYFGHPIAAPRKAEELYRLSIAFFRYLFEREPDGFAGFTTGAQWHEGTTAYVKQEHRYQLGWVGQNTSMANAFLYDYLKNGDRVNLKLALEANDSWIKYATLKKGLLASKVDRHPSRFLPYETMTEADIDPQKWGMDLMETMYGRIGKKLQRDPDGGIAIRNDACNLGTGADGYFEAYDLLQKIGIDRPEYLQTAYDVCEFAMENQAEDGSFAKSWDYKGDVIAKDGTIGCFLILPLLAAYKRTKEQKYLDSAVRAFDFYYQELAEKGFTTAGALDTYSIDKESSSPLLRDALRLYDLTKDPKYVEASEKIGWYLATWQMHFTVHYPEDCMISELGFDTFGSTSVSTPHQALDHYALRDVLSFLKLYELTGNIQWKERGIAFWCNASQGISDGTLYINERLRPAGAQDEAIFHTRWGRHVSPPFALSQWLPAWPVAFRMEDLRWHEDWSFFDEGLTKIEGHL
ncbi:MAG: hypothetical protein J5794_04450 [Lachnospiraceae bacterium]|nr:hypothetical protein [Lachnospiraceae bacterium]